MLEGRAPRQWRMSAGRQLIWSSDGQCGFWSNRESPHEFAYLFFWLTWPALEHGMSASVG